MASRLKHVLGFRLKAKTTKVTKVHEGKLLEGSFV